MNPPWLDRFFERTLGDDDPKHRGTGWYSGVLGAFLGFCSLGAVVILHFPEYLSARDFRALYPIGLVRQLIALIIISGFMLSSVSLILRRRKNLGITGLVLLGMAVFLGGNRVEIDGDFGTPLYIGLDWFFLNIFLLAIVFAPLEQLRPLRDQGIFRLGWTTDALHFLVSHIAVELLTFFTLLPAVVLVASLPFTGWVPWVSTLPIWVQVIAMMLVADLTQYAVHRAFHAIPALWSFHAIHHSSRAMDWLAGSRLHVVDIIVTRASILIPLFLIGFSQTALYGWLVIISFHAVFNHINMDIRLPFIEKLVVTPRFHHWHHAQRPWDKNFAVHFPWIDRIFGTYHLPHGQSWDAWPRELGIEGHLVPEGFVDQLIWPFSPKTQEKRKPEDVGPPADESIFVR